MWPRLLFELLPHFARLLPAADRYLATRGTSEKAQQAALAAVAGDVRGEIGVVVEAQAGIRRQLGEQGAQLGEMAVEVTRVRMGVESVEARVARIEGRMGGLEGRAGNAVKLLGATLAVLLCVVTLLVVVLVRLLLR